MTVVCSCRRYNDEHVRQAIGEVMKPGKTPHDIHIHLGQPPNCGLCKPTIQAMIEGKNPLDVPERPVVFVKPPRTGLAQG